MSNPFLTGRSALSCHKPHAAWPVLALLILAAMLVATDVLAHAVTQGDKGYIQEISGVHLLPFAYLGAKHMACTSTSASTPT
jgi:hypothetical protein